MKKFPEYTLGDKGELVRLNDCAPRPEFCHIRESASIFPKRVLESSDKESPRLVSSIVESVTRELMEFAGFSDIKSDKEETRDKKASENDSIFSDLLEAAGLADDRPEHQPVDLRDFSESVEHTVKSEVMTEDQKSREIMRLLEMVVPPSAYSRFDYESEVQKVMRNHRRFGVIERDQAIKKILNLAFLHNLLQGGEIGGRQAVAGPWS